VLSVSRRSSVATFCDVAPPPAAPDPVKRDLRSRDGEGGKTALQRDGRATHGVARVAIGTAEERFFHGSERSAEQDAGCDPAALCRLGS